MKVVMVPSVSGGIGHISRAATLARALRRLDPSAGVEMVLDAERLRPFNIDAALGMGYVFANYHIVLAEGDRGERGHGVPNTKAMHGCALLTRFPVLRFALTDAGQYEQMQKQKARDGLEGAGARLTACSLRQSIGAAAVVLMLAGCSRAPLAAPDGWIRTRAAHDAGGPLARHFGLRSVARSARCRAPARDQ